MVEYLRTGCQHRGQSIVFAVKIWHEDLDDNARVFSAHGLDGSREMEGSAICHVIASHCRDDHMPQPHTLCSLGNPFWLIDFQSERFGGFDRTKPASPGAAITGDHESGRALTPAFPPVGALRFFANGVQPQVRDQRLR